MAILIPSPLEQFEISPLIPIYFGFLDFSFTNSSAILGLGFSFFFILNVLINSPNSSARIFAQSWQYIMENLVIVSASMLYDNVGKHGEKHFPTIYSLFLLVLISNLIGLVPYSFTATSHLIVTFSLALMVFTGVNIIGLQKQGSNMLCLFLPGGTSFFLALLLVPIEFVSYIFKPISLSVRLFANMMAGHTLLKVIAGFAWSMLLSGGIFTFLHVFPLAAIILLLGLELGVALIQAYVFCILSCIYLNDTLSSH